MGKPGKDAVLLPLASSSPSAPFFLQGLASEPVEEPHDIPATFGSRAASNYHYIDEGLRELGSAPRTSTHVKSEFMAWQASRR